MTHAAERKCHDSLPKPETAFPQLGRHRPPVFRLCSHRLGPGGRHYQVQRHGGGQCQEALPADHPDRRRAAQGPHRGDGPPGAGVRRCKTGAIPAGRAAERSRHVADLRVAVEDGGEPLFRLFRPRKRRLLPGRAHPGQPGLERIHFRAREHMVRPAQNHQVQRGRARGILAILVVRHATGRHKEATVRLFPDSPALVLGGKAGKTRCDHGSVCLCLFSGAGNHDLQSPPGRDRSARSRPEPGIAPGLSGKNSPDAQRCHRGAGSQKPDPGSSQHIADLQAEGYGCADAGLHNRQSPSGRPGKLERRGRRDRDTDCRCRRGCVRVR